MKVRRGRYKHPPRRITCHVQATVDYTLRPQRPAGPTDLRSRCRHCKQLQRHRRHHFQPGQIQLGTRCCRPYRRTTHTASAGAACVRNRQPSYCRTRSYCRALHFAVPRVVSEGEESTPQSKSADKKVSCMFKGLQQMAGACLNAQHSSLYRPALQARHSVPHTKRFGWGRMAPCSMVLRVVQCRVCVQTGSRLDVQASALSLTVDGNRSCCLFSSSHASTVA